MHRAFLFVGRPVVEGAVLRFEPNATLSWTWGTWGRLAIVVQRIQRTQFPILGLGRSIVSLSGPAP
jgi:hypothetical protein